MKLIDYFQSIKWCLQRTKKLKKIHQNPKKVADEKTPKKCVLNGFQNWYSKQSQHFNITTFKLNIK